MSRQKATSEFKSFVKGIITEVSPLNFPDNASIDEDNFILHKDGTRTRRLGMDLEPGYAVVDTPVSSDEFGSVAFSSYSWRNAGGDPAQRIAVIQVGTCLSFFDSASDQPISSQLITQVDGITNKYVKASYAVVDGLLVVATGDKPIHTFEFDGTAITHSSTILYVRDQFGVEDIDPTLGVDLNQSSYVSTRQPVRSNTHFYNLRNQTWGISRIIKGIEDAANPIRDPITVFFEQTLGRTSLYPSNADNLNTSLYPNPDHASDPVTPIFWPRTAVADPMSSSPAPRGYFIIDALERGASRIAECALNQSKYPELQYPILDLPIDRTPGGATVISEFAGRVFFAGFSGEVEFGDNKSPRLSSYVLFSNRIRDSSDINKCYQMGDPTSRNESDILATDGGFIRIDGAFNISGLLPIGKSLLVLAENGVWAISGGSDYGFAADNYNVIKITEHGSISPASAAVVDNTVVYWGDDGIYSIGPDQFATLIATNLTNTTIQSLYDGIDTGDKRTANGIYDSYDRKIRWVYQNSLDSVAVTKELVFDVTLSAFYVSTITNGGINFPKVVSIFEVPPYTISEFESQVVVDDEDVVVGDEAVVYTASVRQEGAREVVYVVATADNPISFSIGYYRDGNFVDWDSLGIGVDAPAYLVTGYISGGDNQRSKQVPCITVFLERTEDGFVDLGDGDIQPIHQSSCLIQPQWNWTNSANSNKWGRTFQAYRYRRFYMPQNSADTYDTGDRLIITKNKLRGIGKVLSLFITTEPGKDCRILGWAMVWGINNDV